MLNKNIRHYIFLIYALIFLPSAALPANCPLIPIKNSQLPVFLHARGVQVGDNPQVLVFTSGLERDEDGAPTAYHRGLKDDGPDPGMDHICNAGDVLEFRNGKLINRYGSGGSVGALSGIDPVSKVSRSKLCKRDYIAIRDAGFPVCGPDTLCMRWYGVKVAPRSCGYNRSKDFGCGITVLQRGPDGRDADFYLTTNILRRPDSTEDSLVQSDYADATKVPFIVIPRRIKRTHPTKTADIFI